ncbi:MAG: CBS domain-containing protein [Betaproteobacteria bacterium]|nr:CBS domain-containing protein [Betaproteobacteria bacterium]
MTMNTIEQKVSSIFREQWTINQNEKCGTLIEAMRKDDHTVVVPVVDNHGVPIGLVEKQAALLIASNPLHYCVHQNKSVRGLMADKCPSFDENTSIDEVASTLLKEGLSLSQGGFLITRNGEYIGVGASTDTLNYLVEANSRRAIAMAKLNEEVMDSVRYASRIQIGLLPTKHHLQDRLHGMDVIWEPRDIVGGDVYWRSEDIGKSFFTVALIDCTGHGVPGALMSMLVLSSLRQIYSENPEIGPGKALAELGNMVRVALNQNREDCDSNDGFDAGVCKIDLDKRKVIFSGARTNCFVIPRDDEPVLRVVSDRQALGYPGTEPYTPLEEYELSIDNYRMFCMASDGIFDQPGGPNRIAFGPKRFVELVEHNRQVDPSSLMRTLHKAAEEWRGDEVRRDDFSAMAFAV